MFFDIPDEFRPYLGVGIGFGVLWFGWTASWLIAALWASRPTKRPPMGEELVYRVLTIVGALLMVMQFRQGTRVGVLWLPPRWFGWLMLALGVAGAAFAWWARIHLGTLWSGRVTRKAEHRIVDTGPYGVVRHPIYTGLIAMLAATVLAFPGPINAIGAIVLIVSFVVKARLEERFLMQELGAEAYRDYRQRVPMLVPFWPVGATR